ncbi:acetate kinase [Arcticibacter tournemirensis]|uniref:Acetate kinase n=1 Tax=Arcticibacter tournemirensis TaxID=699437 RepID=A0A5M9H433_9SPHI|nr:acetate kinase [Arcticibacter tournemirensis]KAA8481686.1 acetate kinase [Arcticibacter tournemirensis]TQM48913.1 acetate kinase [Arcticibacter tournemirensis]
MNIFVVNCGSSSIKYQLFKWPSESPICSGLVERIGLEISAITHKVYINGEEKVIKRTLELPDHEAGMQEVGHLLTEPEIGVIQDPSEIEAVGHRIVHGGESFSTTTIVTPEVKEEIKKLAALAPLHNPAHYVGITVAQKIFTSATQIVVFDTAFHQTMPAKAYRYAIPGKFYTDHGVRVYGFHGTSHKYVTAQALSYLKKPDAKIITIHLGNGCSMAAVNAGQCIDTSMGLGPLDGLIMGTRCGNIDASVVFYLVSQLGYDIEQVDALFNKRSGMLGLTGYSDMRDILKAIEEGDENARLAYDMYAYRIKKYIGAYASALNGLDAIIFTAGVGENDKNLREVVCSNMDFLGIEIDKDKNRERSGELREVNTPGSRVKVMVIPTNEELEIAKECFELLESK